MSQPTLCMVFEAVGPFNAIGKIAAAEVRASLGAGYRVSVVAHRLEDGLRRDVEWLKLYNPRRGFALKWLTARHFVKQALGSRRFDVVHGHQPQIADLCDVFQCHFLTRVAYERDCLKAGRGPLGALREIQQRAVMRAEDRFYSNWNPSTRAYFVSNLLKDEFERLYGLPPHHAVLENAAPPWNPVTPEERKLARTFYGIADERRPVLGYIGGLQLRKGYRELLNAVRLEGECLVLMAGQHTRGYMEPGLNNALKAVGNAGDVQRFYAACDLLVVPSRFDPCPMVVLEAASRGLPIVATEGVGNRATVLRFSAGLPWKFGEPLMPLVQTIMNQRPVFFRGCEDLCIHQSQDRPFSFLLSAYEDVMSVGRGQMTHSLSRNEGGSGRPTR